MHDGLKGDEEAAVGDSRSEMSGKVMEENIW
jgi:hypothetical protein